MVTVLDKGYVRFRSDWVLGAGDLEIVNDARVSFNKESAELKERDRRLIKFLASHEHTAPFRGSVCKLEFYAPLKVARQHWKYIIGSQFDEGKLQDSFTAWNESSRRYITETVEFYLPESNQWRGVAENKKQGSGEALPQSVGQYWTDALSIYQAQGEALYKESLKAGVCPEQARLFLPAYGLYVRYRWTTSLQTLAHFLAQRLAEDAQSEMREYAQAVYELTRPIWVVGLGELLKGVDAPSTDQAPKDVLINPFRGFNGVNVEDLPKWLNRF